MLNVYNTMTRQKEHFEPLIESKVSIYVCGPTVYDVPHIGHIRSAWVFDMLRKYFIYIGFDVNFVRNVTDIDDKIIAKAVKELTNTAKEIDPDSLSEMTAEVSERYLKEYHDRLEKMGIAPPTHEPRATSCINEIIDFVSLLIKKGYAYVSAGNVYFDVLKFGKYGKLSNRRPEELMQGVRVEKDEKKEHPLDFALWKSAKSGEPFWESPWGPGRPGWHIECSAMSTSILGEQFDIHGGGLDLIFPHHENEIAQSEAATGKTFARYWMHNGLLTVRREKMSKSTGNYVTVDDFLEEYKDPDILKISFAFSHYRSPMDYSDEKMKEAEKCKERMTVFFEKSEKILRDLEGHENRLGNDGSQGYLDDFKEAMNDDLNTPQAMAIIFKALKEGNDILSACARGELKDAGKLEGVSAFIRVSTGVLGFSLKKIERTGVGADTVDKLVEERLQAREKRDFKKADRIRESLLEMGVLVEDTPTGSEWRRK